MSDMDNSQNRLILPKGHDQLAFPGQDQRARGKVHLNIPVSELLPGFLRAHGAGGSTCSLVVAFQLCRDAEGEDAVRPRVALVGADGKAVTGWSGDKVADMLEQVAADLREHGSGPLEMIPRAPDKVGRNDPCPCGSGHKSKRCCREG